MKTANSVVLDYSVDVIQLDDADFILDYGELGNFSVAGFEMTLRRHVSHYLITYYLPSGKLSLLRNKPKMAYSRDLLKIARQQCGIMD